MNVIVVILAVIGVAFLVYHIYMFFKQGKKKLIEEIKAKVDDLEFKLLQDFDNKLKLLEKKVETLETKKSAKTTSPTTEQPKQ